MRKDRRWTRRGAPCWGAPSRRVGWLGKGSDFAFRRSVEEFLSVLVGVFGYQIFDILPHPPNNQIILNYTSKTILNDINRTT